MRKYVLTMLALTAFLAALLLSAEADAQQCNIHQRVIRQPVYAAPVVAVAVPVVPVLAAVFVPVPIATYGVGYQRPPVTIVLQSPAAPTDPALAAQVAKLNLLLSSLQSGAELPALKTDGPAAEPEAKGGDQVAVFVNECSRCHEQRVAPTKGKGFVLLIGDQLAPLSERQKLKAISMVHNDLMPPGKKLSDEAYSQLIVGLSN